MVSPQQARFWVFLLLLPKAVRQAAAKFVEWLQEAESDEESDESEDSLAEEE